MVNRILSIFFYFILLFFVINSKIIPQSINTNLFQYLSPVPGAELTQPSTEIIICYGDAYSPLFEKSRASLIVQGEKSGLHKGEFLLLENNKTLTFKPYEPFIQGEKVTVELNKLKLADNQNYTPHLKYSFTIINRKVNISFDPRSYLKTELPVKKNNQILNKSFSMLQDSLPADFPPYTIDYNQPSEGYILFAPWSFPSFSPSYLIITDNFGIPVFYRKISHITFDFQKQINNTLTYNDGILNKYYILNDKYELTDSLEMQNGYSADIHELRILENGHALMFAYDPEYVRMDTIVAGGDPNALVIGLVMQEIDENKNLVFQWRSWDHFNITDATEDIDLTASEIDYVHGNAIEMDYDGNILLSCRHMDEITKIDRTTGNIIWRWGGIHCKNNQFLFLNDSIGFSHQHCIRKLPNGNYTLFDNGNLHSPQFSRAAEYQLDEANRIASLVWENKNDPVSYSAAMGSVERLSNHSTFIGWGTKNNSPDITEVGPDGSPRLAISFPDTTYCYRSFKYDWDTQFFTSDKDSLNFGIVQVGGSATVSFDFTNNSSAQVKINSVYYRDSQFSLVQQLPIVIPSQGSVSLSVKFTPEEEGAFFSVIHLRSQTPGQRIAKVINLIGYTDSVYMGINDLNNPVEFSLSQNYPNPFNPVSRIRYSIPKNSFVKLQVFDILGKEIDVLVNKEQAAGNYEVEFNGSNLASGIYFYRINAGKFNSVKKMLLLK
ncbi:MAG TPA: aryl-sulfate sulfotransferase [Ignavibacteriaceae bacterium]|nr:aryl-sulfate sulfotransferase [Ignavibacteriaceae bacterium]